MKLAEIEREHALTVDPAIQELATQLSEKLGYNVLEKHLEQKGVGELERVLFELEIEPLNWKQVEIYKMEQFCLQVQKASFERMENANLPTEYWEPYITWGETALDKYREPIPEFVLRKAMQIKERIPEVEFFVNELTYAKDPFLVAKLKDGNSTKEKFYIEVWEEPKFEGRSK